MSAPRKRLTYANIVSTLALALVVGGGTAVAAGIAPNSVGSIQIKNGNVKTPDLKNNAVKSVKVKDGTLIGADVADGSLASVDITDESLTSSDILIDSLTSSDLGANSVGQSEIATDGVAASEIQDNSIDAGEIVDNSLFSADLGAGSVRGSELGTIIKRSVISAAIAPGATGSAVSACLAGERIITGGNDGSLSSDVVASRDEGNGWRVFIRNNSGGNVTVTVHAYCLQAS